MNKFYKFLLIILFLISPLKANSHVEHYDNLKLIEFDIYRNNKNIGKHVFSFSKAGDILVVDSKINFEIKKLGIVLYLYVVNGTEKYKDGKLIEFTSKTNANGKDKYVDISVEDDKYLINGSSYKGPASFEYLIGTWWNHSLVKAPAQISAVSGRIIKQNVTFLGKETIDINGKDYKSMHFNFSSSDESLSKDKKLNTDIWYEEESMNWIKATFKKKGNWEYRLIRVE
jgi:hypothetical protein